MGGYLQTGGVGGTATVSGTGGIAPNYDSTFAKYTRLFVMPGSGGGGGSGGNTGNGGAGGRGAGAFYMECGTTYNATGTINANGTVGADASGSGGSGGGGGAGSIVVLYNTLTADSGTYNVTGGSAGAVGSGGPGGAGATGYAIRTVNTKF